MNFTILFFRLKLLAIAVISYSYEACQSTIIQGINKLAWMQIVTVRIKISCMLADHFKLLRRRLYYFNFVHEVYSGILFPANQNSLAKTIIINTNSRKVLNPYLIISESIKITVLR